MASLTVRTVKGAGPSIVGVISLFEIEDLETLLIVSVCKGGSIMTGYLMIGYVMIGYGCFRLIILIGAGIVIGGAG